PSSEGVPPGRRTCPPSPLPSWEGPGEGAPGRRTCPLPPRRVALRTRDAAPGRGPGLRPSLLGRQARRLILRDQRVDELVQLALHDPVDLVERLVDPVVRDPPLREVVRAD